MKIYISGKISGLFFEQVIIKFAASESNLKLQGHCVVNPINIKPLFGIKKWAFYMITDIWYLLKCDAIYLQKDWNLSTGARIEVFVAILTNKKIIIQHDINTKVSH